VTTTPGGHDYVAVCGTRRVAMSTRRPGEVLGLITPFLDAH
jgi:hypothetical protein